MPWCCRRNPAEVLVAARHAKRLGTTGLRCMAAVKIAALPMQLRAEQLAQHLTQPLAALYVLHGDELLTIEAADAIRAAARKQGYDEREVLVVTPNFKWDELTLASGNLSLFGGNKLIDLRIPSGKPGRDGGDALQKARGQSCPGRRHPDQPARAGLASEEIGLGYCTG